ncbi:MAG: glycosyltransferase family 39 protein [Candidatus Tantalella remota]|nr:glycosyltransferase family 39 protein [Candidatus Tantalella remota]
MKDKNTIQDVVILAVISALILLWNLGTGSLTSWDEALYGEVAREILKTSNWIDLHYGGLPWSDKPPLCMWVTAFFYMLLGISEFTVRFFSALCGIGTVIITYLFSKKLYSRKAAIAASLALITTWHFLWFAKLGMLDVPLTFFVTLSLFMFKLGEEHKAALFFSPLAFAFAFLTKGAGAAIIPMILLLYMIFSGKLKILKKPALLWGIFVSLVILVWWHWLAFTHYGDAFIRDYFVKHLLTRTTQAVDGHTGNIFTYLGVIPNKGRPWAWVGLCIIPFIILRIFWKKEKEHLLPVIWAGTVIVIFSMVQTKLHWYIIPLYPALAMMTGWTAKKLFRKYTIVIMSVLAAVSLTYLALDKDIFDADYSPAIKEFSLRVRAAIPEGENIYIYKIIDPGIHFYLGDLGGDLVGKENVSSTLGENGNYIVTETSKLRKFPAGSFSMVVEKDSLVLIQTQK